MTMRARWIHPAVACAALVAALALGAAEGSAQVGRAADLTTIKLTGPAAGDLRAQGVNAGPIAPADGGAKRVSLPVASATLDPASLLHEGGLELRARTRTLRLTALRIAFGRKGKGKASAELRGDRRVLFSVTGRPAVDATARSVAVGGARLVLTAKGTRLLERSLGLEALGSGAFGKLRSRAVVPAPAGPVEPPYESGDLGPPPPVLERPASAESVSQVAIFWHPRDSWLRYVAAAGPAPQGTTVSAGASAAAPADASPCPDRPVGPTPLAYTFSFTPSAESWHDPASGAAAIYGTGAVRFRYDERGIDLTLANAEVEINGVDSRLIFTYTGAGSTTIPTQRAVLTDLVGDGTPTSTAPAPGGGTIIAYELVRGDLAPGGSAAFGAYPPGDHFGCVSVSYVTGEP